MTKPNYCETVNKKHYEFQTYHNITESDHVQEDKPIIGRKSYPFARRKSVDKKIEADETAESSSPEENQQLNETNFAQEKETAIVDTPKSVQQSEALTQSAPIVDEKPKRRRVVRKKSTLQKQKIDSSNSDPEANNDHNADNR